MGTRLKVRALVVLVGWSLLAIGSGAPAAAGGKDATAIAAGAYHSCAVRAGGTVWCWGDASYGQLGDGTTGDANGMRTTPVRVRRGSTVLRGATSVAAGASFSCAVRANGTVWCWGDASVGQLGNGQSGTGVRRTTAVQVRKGSGPLTGVERVATSGNHVCALRTNGSVYCWGSAAQGRVGDGTTGDPVTHLRTTAVRVRRGSGYLDKVTAIAAGHEHTCARRTDGTVWCWGNGFLGSLGDGQSGTGHLRTTATRVRRGSGHLTRVTGIASNGYHTCARRTDGTAWCWGYAANGQIGDGTTGDPTTHLRTKPTRVLRGTGILTGVTRLGAGTDHTCARRSDGSAWCWGSAGDGQLGDGTTGHPTTHLRLGPVRVRRSSGAFGQVRQLVAGTYHTCALRADRTVWCWGSDTNGQLGRGSFDDDPHPYPRRVLFP